MDKNSNLKSSIGNFLTALFDLMLLNLLWVVCSLPVLTMGTATSALFSVSLKIRKGEDVHTFSDFFKAFGDGFKQSFVLGLIAMVSAFIIYVDYAFSDSQEGFQKTLFLVVAVMATVLWLIFVTYSFPLQARFENTLTGHIKNAFALAICSPGRTLLMWLVYAAPVLIALVLGNYVWYIGWAYLLFAVSLPVYINSKTLLKVFEKISQGKENGEIKQDPWDDFEGVGEGESDDEA